MSLMDELIREDNKYRSNNFGIKELLEDYGYESDIELIEDYIHESCVPGICTNCGSTYEYEPDQDKGWCEECKTNTVQSALILVGII